MTKYYPLELVTIQGCIHRMILMLYLSGVPDQMKQTVGNFHLPLLNIKK